MDNIRIEIAQPQQKQAIVEYLLEYFRIDEPIGRAVNMTKDEARPFFNELVGEGLKEPISFLALNEKDEIVGCRLNEIVDLHAADKNHHASDSGNLPYSVKAIANFLDILTKDVEKLLPPDTKRIMKFIAVSVHPAYRRRGIAKELIERSMQLAIDRQCDYVCVAASAKGSQQLFDKKLGYQLLRTIPHSEYRDPATNQQIFNCDDGTDCGKFFAKKLR